MSRVGVLPIALPQGVGVEVQQRVVGVTGPRGQMVVPYDSASLEVSVIEGAMRVARKCEDRHVRALHGLTRALMANAVTGVTTGFSKRLEVHGIGYRADAQGGKRLTLSVGYSHPVVYDAPEGIEIRVEDVSGGAQARIVISGNDKQRVGQVAADIRQKRKPEPYKGKGIRYENEVIHWKAGKAAIG